jgi:hypothetical protein
MWIAVALAAGVVAAGQARAEVAFTAPQVLDSPDSATPQVGVDSQGRVTVVWMDYVPEVDRTAVKAQRLDPTGMPGPVQTLAVVPKAYPQCVCPKVAVDPAGRATVVWQGVTSEGRQIETSHIGLDGIAQPAQVISAPGTEGWYAIPAANQLDEAVVAWKSSGPEGRIESIVLRGGVPGEIHSLSPPDEGTLPVPAASPTDSFYVAWTGDDGIKTTKLDDEGAPEEVHTVSPPGESAGAADLVVDSEGRSTISWWRGFGGNEVRAVRLDADGTPGTVWTLSPPGQETYEARLAIDPQGRVTAVWQTFGDEVYSARLDSEGTPDAARLLSAKGRPAGEPRVVAAPDGRVVVTWTHTPYPFAPEPGCLDHELDPADDAVRAAFIGADGQLERILDVSPHGQQSFSADVALDPMGLPWIAWNSFDGSYFCEYWETRIQISHAVTQPSPEEQPPTPPVPPAPDPVPPLPILQLSKKGRASEDRVVLRARCQGAAGTVCSGKLRLKASVASLRPQSAARAGRKPASVLVARGRYRVPSGKTRKIAVPISSAARSLLAEAGPNWIPASARGPGLAPSSLLIRLPGGAT